MGNPYGADKGAWYGGRVEQLRRGHHPSPVHVQLILSDLCNQSCHFCAYRMEGYSSNELFAGDAEQIRFPVNPNRMIETEKALEIVSDCGQMGVEAIQLTGGGEPSVHPGICDVIDAIETERMSWALVSNGYSWSDELFERIPGATWVRISVDAGSAESYSAIRSAPKIAFERVLGNVTRMRQEIEAAGTDTTLGFGYVVTPENWRETSYAAELARNAGAHNIRFGAMFSQAGLDPYRDIRDPVLEMIADAKERLDGEDFSVIDRFGLALGNMVQAAPDYETCHYQRFTTYIGGDLNVYVCCVYSYNQHGLVGSIRDRSFRAFWEDEETHRFFDRFDARTCDRCQFNDRNRALDRVINQDPPDHVEFV